MKAFPVFVVGSGRCGTTVLDRTIGMHSHYVSFPIEPQIFLSADAKLGLLSVFEGTLDERSASILAEHLHRRFSFKRSAKEYGFHGWLQEDQFEEHVSQLLTDCRLDPTDAGAIVRRFVDSIYAPYLERENAMGWIDGSPVNGRAIPQIQMAYPEARFIHVIRDGRDVAKSFVRKGWASRSYSMAIQFWYSQVTITRRLGVAYGGSNYLEIPFDALVRGAELVIERVCRLLGIAPEPGMFQLISEDRALLYASTHTEQETRYARHMAGDLFEEFGWD